MRFFGKYKIDLVINLAAQAGVRYSLEKPKDYIETNILGFFNLLELSRKYKLKKIIYACQALYMEIRKFILLKMKKFNQKMFIL